MGMGMGIEQWEWEGMGISIVFPHTSTAYDASWLLHLWRKSLVTASNIRAKSS